MRKALALTLGALFAVPLYVALVNVVKDGPQISRSPASLPIPPTLANIQGVLSRPDHLFWASLTNSILVTSLSIAVLTVLSAMLGHYIARTRTRWTRVLTLLLLGGLMIPPQVILMPVTQGVLPGPAEALRQGSDRRRRQGLTHCPLPRSAPAESIDELDVTSDQF